MFTVGTGCGNMDGTEAAASQLFSVGNYNTTLCTDPDTCNQYDNFERPLGGCNDDFPTGGSRQFGSLSGETSAVAARTAIVGADVAGHLDAGVGVLPVNAYRDSAQLFDPTVNSVIDAYFDGTGGASFTSVGSTSYGAWPTLSTNGNLKADTDADGLPDAWESTYNATNPLGDCDGDGYLNIEEAANGTDPGCSGGVLGPGAVLGSGGQLQ